MLNISTLSSRSSCTRVCVCVWHALIPVRSLTQRTHTEYNRSGRAGGSGNLQSCRVGQGEGCVRALKHRAVHSRTRFTTRRGRGEEFPKVPTGQRAEVSSPSEGTVNTEKVRFTLTPPFSSCLSSQKTDGKCKQS